MKEFSEKELLLLAYLEGDLNDADKAKAEALLAADEALQAEYKLLQHTKLPKPTAEYSRKAQLKRPVPVAKKKPVLAYILWPTAVAASLALLFVFTQTAENSSTSTTASATIIEAPQLAQQTPPAQTNAEINGAPTENTQPRANYENKTQAAVANNAATQAVVASTTPQPLETVKTKTTINVGELVPSKMVSLAASKQNNVPPIIEQIVEVDGQFVPYTAAEAEGQTTRKNWLARTTSNIGNQIGTWVGLVKNPQVDINKKEAEGGRTYWALTLTTETYEWEGVLYTQR